MVRRGQFFLIAAIIIVGILIGSIFIYNSVRVNKKEDISYVAKNIQYELSRKIDYLSSTRESVGIDDYEILMELNKSAVEFSKNNLEIKIFVLYVSRENELLMSFFEGGREIEFQDSALMIPQIELDGSNSDKLIIKGRDEKVYYIWQLKEGVREVHVYLQKEKENGEKSIDAA